MARFAVALALVASVLAAGRAASASSAVELVEMARAHERAREDDVALRRYMDALGLDPTCDAAYLGLGALRARRGDLREADRVYSVALEHRPQLREARTARAYVRRALGLREDAIADLLAVHELDAGALRVIAGWYGEDGLAPAQLATWRKLGALAEKTGNATLAHEATTMVKALVLLVGPADPAAAPPDESGGRKLVARLARRG